MDLLELLTVDCLVEVKLTADEGDLVVVDRGLTAHDRDPRLVILEIVWTDERISSLVCHCTTLSILIAILV